MQKIISWNVASIRARWPVFKNLLRQESPDIVLLQEIKATEDTFPIMDCQMEGYHAYISGQKGFNGVAILSRCPLKNITTQLPNLSQEDSEQARFIQAENENNITFICVYIPNGNPPEKDPTDTSRLAYKHRWMHALTKHISNLIHEEKKLVLGGDFNVIERDDDVYNPDLYRSNALMLPSVRSDFGDLTRLPIDNLIRRFNPTPHTYSFWDFQGGAWPKNNGMLLDYLFVSHNLSHKAETASIYKDVRGWPKTSDHAPIGCLLKDI